MVRILLLCIFWLLATAAQAEEGDQKSKDKQALMTSIYPLALLINSAWPNDVEAGSTWCRPINHLTISA